MIRTLLSLMSRDFFKKLLEKIMTINKKWPEGKRLKGAIELIIE